jgi:hypothetical protein
MRPRPLFGLIHFRHRLLDMFEGLDPMATLIADGFLQLTP